MYHDIHTDFTADTSETHFARWIRLVTKYTFLHMPPGNYTKIYLLKEDDNGTTPKLDQSRT